MPSFLAAAAQAANCWLESVRHRLATRPRFARARSRSGVAGGGRRGRLRTTWPCLVLTYTSLPMAPENLPLRTFIVVCRVAGWPVSLELFGTGEQVSDAGEQAAGRAAIEDAMIETEGHVGFHGGHELALRRVPIRHAPGRAHAQHEGLLGQRDRRGPGEAEGAEVGHRGD